MIVMDRHRMVFVGTPKAACNSMYAWLERHLDGRREPFHQRDVPAEAGGYWRFTVVRNPYPRAVSMWWSMMGQGEAKEHPATRFVRREGGDTSLPSFLRWVLRRAEDGYACENLPGGWIGPQAFWLEPAEPLDAFLRLESLEKDLAVMLRDLRRFGDLVGQGNRLPPVGRLNENRTEYGPWRRLMTNEVVELIDAWAQDDFDRFGYARWEGAAVGA